MEEEISLWIVFQTYISVMIVISPCSAYEFQDVKFDLDLSVA